MPSSRAGASRRSARRRPSASPLPDPQPATATLQRPPQTGETALDIAVITMKFPVASETFVSARLATLRRMGNRVRVLTLRRPVAEAEKLAAERKLGDLELNQNGYAASLRGALVALRRPRLLASTLSWLWRCNRRRPGHLLRAITLVPRSFDVLAALENDPPDLLHLEWGHFPVVAARLVQLSLPEVVVSVSLIAYDLNTEFGGTVDVVRDADVVRTQAEINVEQIARFTGLERERIAVIYDGVDVARLERMTSVAEKEPGRVVYAGRLVPEKAVDDVIKVFAAARAAAPHASLHVLGDGPERSRLEALATELGVRQAVTFCGHISHEGVMQQLTRAEVLLHLSRTERLPNVIKEAMVCECVPITTSTEGIAELVAHGETGFVVEHGDLDQATATLSQILAGGIDTAPMIEAARRYIVRNFDHQLNVERLVALWREALPGAQAASDERDPPHERSSPDERAAPHDQATPVALDLQ